MFSSFYFFQKKINFSKSIVLFALLLLLGCQSSKKNVVLDTNLTYPTYHPSSTDQLVDREKYFNQLYGFWLATCIANWTGLVTEMDKIGDIGEIKTGKFYTREDWGKPDLPNIWDKDKPSKLSPTIDFVYPKIDSLWGADDDTDIEYIYQELLFQNQTHLLTGEQIRDGWLKHINVEEENYLWVSNQKAFDLMREGMVSPATSDPKNNPEWEMIDAQLTTEIFGLLAPTRPDIALEMSHLPIRTTAFQHSAYISKFYVKMFSLATMTSKKKNQKEKIFWMAEQARDQLPEDSYSSKMYDFVKSLYDAGIPWEEARDSVYVRYQVEQKDGYDITSQKIYCNGCFAAGINFAASLVSLFYGEGDLIETIKIGTLCGWDSDNPTATWAGLLGFMIGKEGIEEAFGKKFSEKYHIHRTRTGFENDGIDTFQNMAQKGVFIIDRMVQTIGGGVDLQKDVWHIPSS